MQTILSKIRLLVVENNDRVGTSWTKFSSEGTHPPSRKIPHDQITEGETKRTESPDIKFHNEIKISHLSIMVQI